MNPMLARRKEQRKLKRSDYETDQGSVVWTVLLMGLIFCLADVAYILAYVETQPGEAVLHNTASASAAIESNRAEISFDKEPILKILREAGITEVDDETMKALPTWSEVTALYGDHPRIYGLDQCEVFQSHSDPADHFLSTAGTFNSGTNLMAELLIHNCHMPARMKKYGPQNRGIRWQVPWGKHSPPMDEEYRQSHKTRNDKDVDANDILPAVTIRDPYVWMNSMCRHKYSTNWPHTMDHCPNLVPDERDTSKFKTLKGTSSIPVRVKYPEFRRVYDSLVHMWNEWYGEYVKAGFPRIIVRFEDLVFHPKEVTEAVCHCAGGQINNGKFTYIMDSAKKGLGAHGNERTGYIDAIIRYGKDKGRLTAYSPDDLAFARKTLDRDLMEFFGYLDPPTTATTTTTTKP